jgi:hypothetical protein
MGPAGIRILILPLTMASVSRTVGFHRLRSLHRPVWNESRTREVLGAVGNASGHSHEYGCAVHPNLDVPAFPYGKTLPACEAIVAYVFGRIAPRLPAGLARERVRIMEDPTLYADCTGPH